jgi:predicted nicotinamide N-methyase
MQRPPGHGTGPRTGTERIEVPVPTPAAAVRNALAPVGNAGIDGLRLRRLPVVPEVRLYLADDAILLQARLEAQDGRRLATPYWADAWAGGQAVARYVLDHPHLVAGRRVLDVASGSGVAAIAAAVAGAAAVTANDIDPYALAAIALNASASGVAVTVNGDNLLAGDGGGPDVVLAGDVFYDSEMAGLMLAFIERAAARGAVVLVGDPGRGHLPRHRLRVVATYPALRGSAGQDAQVTEVHVLRPTTSRVANRPA